MNLAVFLEKINNNKAISFDETIEVINENYDYQPTEFSNGLDNDLLINAAGTNEASCRIFAFALLNNLSQQQTLSLFGDYYQKDVLNNPEGLDHKNIRNFMLYGFDGIHFKSNALKARYPNNE
jgi:hypothetical protein